MTLHGEGRGETDRVREVALILCADYLEGEVPKSCFASLRKSFMDDWFLRGTLGEATGELAF